MIRKQTFVGCYHVSTNFPRTVQRVAYSRSDWSLATDQFRHDGGKGMWQMMLPRMLLNLHIGERVCHLIRKTGQVATLFIDVHSG